MKKTLLMVACMVMFFWFVPGLSVKAAESDDTEWLHEYEISSFYNRTVGNIASTEWSGVIKTDYPVYGFYYDVLQGNDTVTFIRYSAVVPDGVGKDKQRFESSGTQTDTWKSGTIVTDSWSPSIGFITSENWINLLESSNFESSTSGLRVYDNLTVTFPVFEDAAALVRFLKTGDLSGWVNKPPLDLELNGVLNESFEIPVLSVDSSGYDFTFVNGSDNVYFELMGRWWSVDDVEFYKEHLMWKHKYSTLLKSDLTTWVSVDDKALSTKKYNLEKLGEDNFNLFLIKNPISLRTFSGGTNAFGNYFSGYTDAVNMFKMQLETPGTMYVGVEVYVRYYTEDEDGNLFYSRWTHYYDNLANPSGSSGSSWDDKDNLFGENQSKVGLTTSEILGLEDKGNSRQDGDLVANYNNYTNFIDDSENLLKSINGVIGLLADSVSLLGSFPAMLAQVFSFLPSWIINFISLSLAVIIILRIVGR